MVQIIVNEDEHNNEKLTEKIDETLKEVKELKKFEDNIIITDLILEEGRIRAKDIENIVDGLNKHYILVNKRFEEMDKKIDKIMEKLSSNNGTLAEPKSEKPKIITKGTKKPAPTAQGSKKHPMTKVRKRKNDGEKFEPAEYSKSIWKKLKLMNDGEIIDKTRSVYHLPVDVYDLLYIIECDETGLTHGEFKELYKDFESNNNTMGKIVYNIRKHSFDKILHKYYESIRKVRFAIKDGYLQVNGQITEVSKSKANEWIQLMFNANRKQKTIREIMSANPKIPKNLIHLVCDNYDNNNLLNIVKPADKEQFVENNPSRRRNLIRNGGIL